MPFPSICTFLNSLGEYWQVLKNQPLFYAFFSISLVKSPDGMGL